MERQTSTGTLPTVDLATLKDKFGNPLCCIVYIEADGTQTLSDAMITLAAARAFVEGYNSLGRLTGRFAEIREVAGTLQPGKRLAMRERKAGAV